MTEQDKHTAGPKLTKAQRAKLVGTPDEWSNQGGDWKAGRVFLDLEDRGLVEMRLRSRSDTSRAALDITAPTG